MRVPIEMPNGAPGIAYGVTISIGKDKQKRARRLETAMS
jgi:hypothetical protein